MKTAFSLLVSLVLFSVHAGERLAEAGNMFAAGEHRTAGNLLRDYERSFNLTMGGIESAAARGLDVSRPLEEIEIAAGRNTEVLTRLLEEVPEQAGPGIRRAIEVSGRGRNRARDMRGRLERGGMPSRRREGVVPAAPGRRGPPARRPPPGRPEEVETPEEREPPETPGIPELPGGREAGIKTARSLSSLNLR